MKKTLALLTSLALTVAAVSTTQAQVVSVTANPLWTDTGIDLSGNCVCISAEGSWTWGADRWFGPDGDYQPNYAYDEWVQNGYHGQLIAFVGSDPLTGAVNEDYYSIGSKGKLCGLEGRLWLGFNDDYESDAISDNYGSVRATIAQCPDGGASLGLLSGALGLLAMIRRQLSR